MSDRPLVSPLREADEMLAKVTVPHHLTQRLRWSLMRRAAVRSTKGRKSGVQIFAPATITIAAVSSLFLISMVVWVVRHSSVGACVTMQPGGAVSLQGSCALDLPTMLIESDGTAQLRESSEGVRLLEGTVLFSVRPVSKGHPPVHVWVGGAAIEVLGTRFRVSQSKEGGSIQLIEGTIRFTFPNGDVSLMHAGETLSWAETILPSQSFTPAGRRPASPEKSAAPTAGEPNLDARPSGVAVDLDGTASREAASINSPPLESLQEEGARPSTSDVMRRFESLRSDARYTETELLRQQLEPVSFDLGNALQHEHASLRRICDHWRWHLEHFPSGVYNGSIRVKMARLSCDEHVGD
jgi:hypothetical protein